MMIDIGKELQDAFDDGYRKRDAEIVRCKDCKYFKKYGFKLEYTECLHFDCDVSEDGYCAWGAKMDEVEKWLV